MAIEGLSIRLYLDHNVHQEVGLAVRRLGYDVVLAREGGNAALDDRSHLAWATDHRRTMLTFDRDDFPALHLDCLRRGQSHGGIIVSLAPPRLPFREILGRLVKVLDTLTADDMIDRLLWLDDSWSPSGSDE